MFSTDVELLPLVERCVYVCQVFEERTIHVSIHRPYSLGKIATYIFTVLFIFNTLLQDTLVFHYTLVFASKTFLIYFKQKRIWHLLCYIYCAPFLNALYLVVLQLFNTYIVSPVNITDKIYLELYTIVFYNMVFRCFYRG